MVRSLRENRSDPICHKTAVRKYITKHGTEAVMGTTKKVRAQMDIYQPKP
jgi:hypothetical protein